MSEQYEGRSAAEAAIKACEALGVTRSALRYSVVSDVGQGLERRVTIAVEVDQAAASAREPEVATDDNVGNARTEMPQRVGRDRERRGGRGPRDRDDPRGTRRGPRPAPAEAADDGIEKLLKLEAVPTETLNRRPEVNSQLSPLANRAKTVTNDIVRFMGLGISGRVVQDDAEEVHLDLVGADEARIIGKKGDVLLSLQFLVNRIVSRDVEGQGPVVVLDAAGYRERRREALSDLARRLAGRALQEKKAVRLSPMSAHDRRVFHMTLKDMDGITTRSEGDGIYRHLLIIPSEFA